MNYSFCLKLLYPDLTDDQFRLVMDKQGLRFTKWDRKEPQPNLANLDKHEPAIEAIIFNQEQIKALIKERNSYDWYYIRVVRDSAAVVPEAINTKVETLQNEIDQLQIETEKLKASIQC